jgi:hypothetical protein
LKKVLCLCLATVFLGACQKDRNNDPVKNVAEASKDRDLQGKVFVSECAVKPVEAIVTGFLAAGAAIKAQLPGADAAKKDQPVPGAGDAAKKDQPTPGAGDAAKKDQPAPGAGDAAKAQAPAGEAAIIKGQRVAYLVSGANITRTTRYFVSADCAGDAALTLEEKGTITLDKNQKTNDGGYNIDIDYNKLEVKISTKEGAEAASRVKFCGHEDWAVDQIRDVTAKAKEVNCYGAPVPRHISNIYRVDANILYFGPMVKANTTKEERPKILNFADRYVVR